MNTKEQIQQIVSDVLDVDLKKISADLRQEDLAEWDSLAQLRIMNALEQEFEVTPTMKQVFQLNSIPAITQFIESSQVTSL